MDGIEDGSIIFLQLGGIFIEYSFLHLVVVWLLMLKWLIGAAYELTLMGTYIYLF